MSHLKNKEKTCAQFYAGEFPVFIYFGLLFYFLFTFDTRILVTLLMGFLLSGIIVGVQRITQMHRPCRTCRCAHCVEVTRPKIYKNGNPSGHTAAMFYFSTIFSVMCAYSIKQSTTQLAYLRILSILIVYGISTWIAVSRVTIRCHYAGQVVLGAIAGITYGMVTATLLFSMPYKYI